MYLEILVSDIPADKILRQFALGFDNTFTNKFETASRLSNTQDKVMIKIKDQKAIPADLLRSGTLLTLTEAKAKGRSAEYKSNYDERQRDFDSFVTDDKSDIPNRTITEDDYNLDKLDERLVVEGVDRLEIDRIKQSLKDRQTKQKIVRR